MWWAKALFFPIRRRIKKKKKNGHCIKICDISIACTCRYRHIGIQCTMSKNLAPTYRTEGFDRSKYRISIHRKCRNINTWIFRYIETKFQYILSNWWCCLFIPWCLRIIYYPDTKRSLHIWTYKYIILISRLSVFDIIGYRTESLFDSHHIIAWFRKRVSLQTNCWFEVNRSIV